MKRKKKVLLFVLTLVLLFTLALPVLASEGNYVPSPTLKETERVTKEKAATSPKTGEGMDVIYLGMTVLAFAGTTWIAKRQLDSAE